MGTLEDIGHTVGQRVVKGGHGELGLVLQVLILIAAKIKPSKMSDIIIYRS